MTSTTLKQAFLENMEMYKALFKEGYDLKSLDKKTMYLLNEASFAETEGYMEMDDFMEVKKSVLKFTTKIRYILSQE